MAPEKATDGGAENLRQQESRAENSPYRSTTLDDAALKRLATRLGVRRQRAKKNSIPEAGAAVKSLRMSRPVEELSAMLDSLGGLSVAYGVPYEYQPLASDEIRLLVLHRGTQWDDLYGHLEHHRLSATGCKTSYHALSYHWGTQHPGVRIHLTNFYETSEGAKPKKNHQSQVLWIRYNLRNALLQLREDRRGKDVYLWVDAICINQEDNEEKAQQVAKMGLIYSQAENVHIWLGGGEDHPMSLKDPDDEAEDANLVQTRITETLKILRESLTDFGSLNRLTQPGPENARKWEAIIELLTNEWFSRRWVVQELALAKRATVHFGSEIVLWKDLSEIIAMIGTKHDDIQKLLLNTRLYSGAPAVDLRSLAASTLVETSNNLFRRNESGQISQRLITMEGLVSMLLSFETADPRDTIFAMLSIAKDSPFSNMDGFGTAFSADSTDSHPVKVDYKASFLDVCTNFMSYCVEASDSLDIICRPWAPVTTITTGLQSMPSTSPPNMMPLPSWATQITRSSFGRPKISKHQRVNGESFVGIPHRQGQRSYDASLGRSPDYEFGKFTPCQRYDRAVSSNELLSTTTPSQPLATSGYSGRDVEANADSALQVEAEVYEPIYDGTLRVKGIIVDQIGDVSARVADGIITRECLSLGGWDSAASLDDQSRNKKSSEQLLRPMIAEGKLESFIPPRKWFRPPECAASLDDQSRARHLPEHLWRTMVADRGPDGINAPPTWYKRACMECLRHVNANGDLNTKVLLNWTNLPPELVAFLNRAQSVIWERCFLKSAGCHKESTYFGLGPTEVAKKDLICILYGCSVPVVLREVGDGKYKLIGEAYIHGLMDGEALEGTSYSTGSSYGNPEDIMFTIV